MARAIVYYVTQAAYSVEVDVPDDYDPEDDENQASREDKARELADEIADFPTLCHFCSGNIDLGDFEPDESSDGVEFIG